MDYRMVLTTCTYCGCGCNFFLEVMDGQLIGTLPCKTSPTNEGKLCIKGWNVHEFVQSPKRLTKPLLRKNGELTEVSWDEALTVTAEKLRQITDEHGADSLAFLASAKVTNEENYLLQKFARAGVGTNNIDHCARLWHSSTVAGLAAAFGSGAMTNSMSEIEDADCIFIIGSNTTSSHPLVATRVYRAKEKGATLLVADPRRIQIANKADIAVRHNLGSDVALLNGMMHAILKNGWQDQSFIDERTEGFAEFQESVMSVPLDKAAEISGVPAETIEAMAKAYAQAERSTILYCMGITQHTTGVDNVKSLANLAMLTGNLGREATGVNPLRGQNNVQGACDMGGLPNVFPAYQPVTSPEAQEKMNAAWKGVKIPGSVGLALPEMLKGAEDGSVKAFFVLGENPVLSDPDSEHVRKALKNLDFLVVQDLFLTETAEMADVVLPGASFAEKDGTFTNTERRVMRVRQAIEPVGDSRADWEIIQDLATRFGYPLSYASPAEIMDEIATVTPSYAGISYERLEGPGLQWPCPSPEHPGTPILHQGQFTRGKGLFHAIDYRPPAEVVDDEYPLWLTTGRVFAHYHTGSMTRNSPSLEGEISEGLLEIHPQDADRLGIHQGEKVYVSSRRGSIMAKTVLTDNIRPGVVFMPFHFVESCANILTNPAMDPIAKIPEYKVCAVNLEKVA